MEKTELFYMRAQNQWTMDIYGNGTWNVLKDIAGGQNNPGNFTWAIANNATTTVTGTKTTTITGAETYTNKDNFTGTVDKDYTLTVTGNLTIKAKTITLDAQQAFAITSDGANIQMTASAGNVAAKAMQVQLQGSTSLSAQAPQVSIEGQAQAAVKGATVQIQGQAMVQVSGPMIKISP